MPMEKKEEPGNAEPEATIDLRSDDHSPCKPKTSASSSFFMLCIRIAEFEHKQSSLSAVREENAEN